MYHQTFPNHLNSPATTSGAYIKPVTDNIYILPNHLKNQEKISVFVMPTSTYRTNSLKSSLTNLFSNFNSSLVAKEVRSFSDICLSCFYQWNAVLSTKTITPTIMPYKHLFKSLLTSFISSSNLFISSLVAKVSNLAAKLSNLFATPLKLLSNTLTCVLACFSLIPDATSSSKACNVSIYAIYLSSLSFGITFQFILRKLRDFFSNPGYQFFVAGNQIHVQSRFFLNWNHCINLYFGLNILFLHHISPSILINHNKHLESSVFYFKRALTLKLHQWYYKFLKDGFKYNLIAQRIESANPIRCSQLNLNRRLSHV